MIRRYLKDQAGRKLLASGRMTYSKQKRAIAKVHLSDLMDDSDTDWNGIFTPKRVGEFADVKVRSGNRREI
jgi:hypothetical protein